MYGVPGNWTDTRGPGGHTVQPDKEKPKPPSDAEMAASALSRLEDAAKEHSIAVHNALDCVVDPTPEHLVNLILIKGIALDHALMNASKWHTQEVMAKVSYLHPMYIEDVLAGMF